MTLAVTMYLAAPYPLALAVIKGRNYAKILYYPQSGITNTDSSIVLSDAVKSSFGRCF